MQHIKNKIPLSSAVGYNIPCICGSCDIGQTKRLVATTLKEHIYLRLLNIAINKNIKLNLLIPKLLQKKPIISSKL